MIQDASGNLVTYWVDVRELIFYLVPNFGPVTERRVNHQPPSAASAIWPARSLMHTVRTGCSYQYVF